MNIRTKWLCLILALSMVLGLLSACGGSQPAPTTAPAQTEATQTEAPQTEPTQQPAPEAPQPVYYAIGDTMEDFTVTTFDGKELTLSKLLEEKDMVLINLWASWCGPCAMEFPAMQEAYEQYQDKVEIIALSVEAKDTDQILAEYVQKHGMTFPVCLDSVGMGSRIDRGGAVPTSVIVDRFGKVCMVEVGAMVDSRLFTDMFEIFTAEDYTQSLYPMSFFSQLCDVPANTSQEISQVLNGEDGALTFENSTNGFDWPMTVTKEGGKNVLVSSNNKISSSCAVVRTTVQAKADDVLCVRFMLENGSPNSKMTLNVDGQVVKTFASHREWGSYAHVFPEDGTFEVEVSFTNEYQHIDQDSRLWLESIQLLQGEAAKEALAQNPNYQAGSKTELTVVNENARAAVMYLEKEPDNNQHFYLLPEDTVTLFVTLDASIDPESAYISDTYNEMHPLLPHATEGGYLMEIPLYGELSEVASLYVGDEYMADVFLFTSEEDIESACKAISENRGTPCLWKYETQEEAAPAGEVTYTVTYTDQNGDPVPGVMCQVCDDTLCQVYESDANGVCTFTLPGYAYEIHTLRIPEGYEGDTTTVTKAPVQGGELTFQLTKK